MGGKGVKMSHVSFGRREVFCIDCKHCVDSGKRIVDSSFKQWFVCVRPMGKDLVTGEDTFLTDRRCSTERYKKCTDIDHCNEYGNFFEPKVGSEDE